MPSAYSVPTPTVAAMTQVTGPASSSTINTSRAALRRSGTPIRRATSQRPASACTVDPAAMQSAARLSCDSQLPSAKTPD